MDSTSLFQGGHAHRSVRPSRGTHGLPRQQVHRPHSALLNSAPLTSRGDPVQHLQQSLTQLSSSGSSSSPYHNGTAWMDQDAAVQGGVDTGSPSTSYVTPTNAQSNGNTSNGHQGSAQRPFSSSRHPRQQLHDARLRQTTGRPQQQTEGVTQQQLHSLVQQSLGPTSIVWRLNGGMRVGEAVSEHCGLDSQKAVAAHVERLMCKGAFTEIIQFFVQIQAEGRQEALSQISHAKFMQAAAEHHASKAALRFLQLLPKHCQTSGLYTMAFQVCAASRDLHTGFAVLALLEQQQERIPISVMHLTTLIKVCKSVGDVDRAISVFSDIKSRGLRLDGHVYGALVAAFADAMTRDMTVVHERKEQYKALERAFQFVAEAKASNVFLGEPVWNALMVCAGRCGELTRAFGVLDNLKESGLAPTAVTYGALIESCVLAQQPDRAMKVFQLALAKGFTGHVELYTQAISACKVVGAVNWEVAMDTYALMQRNHVKADKKLFACLIAVAGRAGKLDLAFGLLSEMAAEGIAPSPTTISALIYACLAQNNMELARAAYDCARERGVLPVLSQYNRMMEWYACAFRFGDVVALLSDMVKGGLKPNLNTYRIVIIACQRAGQAQLAFEVFSLLQNNKIAILQESFAQTIYFQLIKACFNQARSSWAPRGQAVGYPPRATDATSSGSSSVPWQRTQEAEVVLRALSGGHLKPRTSIMQGPPDSINWASQAVSTYQHMLAHGHKPRLSAMNTLFNVLRQHLELPPLAESSTGDAFGSAGGQRTATASRDDTWETREQDHSTQRGKSRYEVGFDPRVFAILEQAINRSILPRYEIDKPVVFDCCDLPPTVAEVYVLAMFKALYQRAERNGHDHHNHSITFLVPPFDPDAVSWPSYVEKEARHHTAHLTSEQLASLVAGNGLPAANPPAEKQRKKRSSASEQDDQQQPAAQQEEETRTAEQPKPQYDPLYGRPYYGDADEDEADMGEVEVEEALKTELTALFGDQFSPRMTLPDGSGSGGSLFGDFSSGGSSANGYSSDRNSSVASAASLQSSYASSSESSDDEQAQYSYNGGDSGYSSSYSYSHLANGPAAEYNIRATTGLAVAATVRRLKVFGSQINWADGAIVLTPVAITSWLINKRHFEQHGRGGAFGTSVSAIPGAASRATSALLNGAPTNQNISGMSSAAGASSSPAPPSTSAADSASGSHSSTSTSSAPTSSTHTASGIPAMAPGMVPSMPPAFGGTPGAAGGPPGTSHGYGNPAQRSLFGKAGNSISEQQRNIRSSFYDSGNNTSSMFRRPPGEDATRRSISGSLSSASSLSSYDERIPGWPVSTPASGSSSSSTSGVHGASSSSSLNSGPAVDSNGGRCHAPETGTGLSSLGGTSATHAGPTNGSATPLVPLSGRGLIPRPMSAGGLGRRRQAQPSATAGTPSQAAGEAAAANASAATAADPHSLNRSSNDGSTEPTLNQAGPTSNHVGTLVDNSHSTPTSTACQSHTANADSGGSSSSTPFPVRHALPQLDPIINANLAPSLLHTDAAPVIAAGAVVVPDQPSPTPAAPLQE